MPDSTLLKRFDSVCERLEKAIKASGRSATEVELIAVSKWHSAVKVASLASYWSSFSTPIFGESYVQESLPKQEEVNSLLCSLSTSFVEPKWHFIGGLQSRKSKDVIGCFDLIHSVDSEKLAKQLSKAWENYVLEIGSGNTSASSKQNILLQVNIGREEQKSGVYPDLLFNLCEQVQKLPGLNILGLMCIPPAVEKAEQARVYFSSLRDLRDKLRAESGLELSHLSMGMSSDFSVAVEEGATFVRIGTDIFGPRDYLA